MIGSEPVGAPLPRVARNRVNAQVVGRECVDGTRPGVAVLSSVFVGEFALPDIALVFAINAERIAPRIDMLVTPAARSELPLGLRGQAEARPATVHMAVIPRDVDNWMIRALGNV